jgi:hypothetical protein
MYKKITHQIVEEHFDHPVMAEAAARTGCNIMPMFNTVSQFSPPAVILPINTEAGVQLRMDANNYFSSLASAVRSFIISTIAGSDDQPLTEERLVNLSTLDSIVRPYYGPDAALAVDQKLKAIVLDLIELVKLAKGGRDIAPATAKVFESIGALATLLSTANPTYWPKSAVISIWESAAKDWATQAVSRHKKDWLADQAAADSVVRTLVSGQPDGSPGFATIVAKGIIDQFPGRFPS